MADVTNPGVTQAALDAAAANNLVIMQSYIPPLASSAPPAVAAATGLTGTAAATARADHTHATSVQRQRIQVTLSGGVANVTFPTAYTAVPVVIVAAETPTGAAYINVASIVQGSITTTGFQVAVNKLQQSVTVSVLGTSVNLFAGQTGSVYIEYLAGAPTA